MKKKIFGVALIAAMAVAASWNFNQSKNEVSLTDLALANIEALAEGGNAGDPGGGGGSSPICRTNRDHSAICNVYDKGDVCPCGF